MLTPSSTMGGAIVARRGGISIVPRGCVGGALPVMHPDMSREHKITIRVRYPEVDAMGYLHHSRYFQYFEMGRIELLRSLGHSYADIERDGVFFVVAKVDCKYKAPARYDDELT